MLVATRSPCAKKFGDAKIELIDPKSPPRREEQTIFLPKGPGVTLAPILKNTQFILRRERENEVWFGGTDERPFLVQLDRRVWGWFESGGEQEIFNALKPSLITDEEQKINRATERQGDIFFLDYGFDWKHVNSLFSILRGKKLPKTNPGSHAVFGTRHVLEGEMCRIETADKHIYTFGTGTLKAPDHADRELPTVHLLAQATCLFNPAKAD